MKKSAVAVQDALDRHGITSRVVELPASTRTAKDAAEAIGCDVAQIAKSIIFRLKDSNTAVLVIASGSNRIDEKIVSKLVDASIEQADPNFVRTVTGFAIGGVPPTGHTNQLKTFIDTDIFQFEKIWAAAGTPNAVFCLSPAELELISGGTLAAVSKAPDAN